MNRNNLAVCFSPVLFHLNLDLPKKKKTISRPTPSFADPPSTSTIGPSGGGASNANTASCANLNQLTDDPTTTTTTTTTTNKKPSPQQLTIPNTEISVCGESSSIINEQRAINISRSNSSRNSTYHYHNNNK